MDTAETTHDSNPAQNSKHLLNATQTVASGTVVWAPTPASLGLHRPHRFGGLDPVLQQFPLEADDWGQHGFVLDFCGRDDNAAVHEVCHGVRHLSLTLGLEHCFVEHLGRTVRTSVEVWLLLFNVQCSMFEA